MFNPKLRRGAMSLGLNPTPCPKSHDQAEGHQSHRATEPMEATRGSAAITEMSAVPEAPSFALYWLPALAAMFWSVHSQT